MKVSSSNEHDPVHLPTHLRCFATFEGDGAGKSSQARRTKVGPSEVTLTFDTETTTDAPQRSRILFYQLRLRGELDEEGAAYDPGALSAREVMTLKRYCAERELLPPITVDAFRQQVFLEKAYACGAEIIGLNLAFDLARIAIDAAPARVTSWRRKMRGAFTLKLSEDSRWPNLQIKHLNSRAAIYEFTAPGRQFASRSDRRREQRPPTQRGYFTDVRTLAGAVLGGSHSLASLTATLKTPTRKRHTEEHGGPLTFDYLDYARADVQATWECFKALCERYRSYGLDAAHYELFSEASLGKATLEAMGVRPWLSGDPSPDPKLLGRIMGSYFGGRTEVRWRKTIRRVIHTDFTSMYPTVCVLQGLWRFITAEGFTTRDSTQEARAFLAAIDVDDLQRQETWKQLATLVRVRPDRDLFPVRAPYGGEHHATIGLNYLTYDGQLWLTMADCIVAKLLSGKAPEVLEASTFEPGPVQRSLKPLKLFGRHEIDPRRDDLFRRLIRLRIEEKERAKTLDGAEAAIVCGICDALKTTANSSSYGIFVQVNVATEDRGLATRVHGPDGETFTVRSRKIETPGPFFHPLLATLITGAARLMLGLAEYRAAAEGLDWVFCDTDSLALTKPDDLADADFEERAQRVVDWFAPLNPYGLPNSILKVEDPNFSHVDPGRRVPLYCLAISSKRYVFFNLGEDGRPIIRKGSAHGLGHLVAPYGENEPAPDIPEPIALGEGKDKLVRWQHDLWFKIVEAELAGRLEHLQFDYHPALRRPAVSRYSATSPELLRWLKAWNDGKAYAQQVKPFGFLLSLHVKREKRGRADELHPIAPYDTDLPTAVRGAFDRITGSTVPLALLQTYQDALEHYQRSPEAKFLNAQAFDRGRTERRHVIATDVELIGKEADRWEESFFLGTGVDPTISYGRDPARMLAALAELQQAAEEFGDAATAEALGVSRASIAKIRQGRDISMALRPGAISARIRTLRAERALRHEAVQLGLSQLHRAVAKHGGIRPAARALGIDPANLKRRLKRHVEGRPE